MSWQVSVSASFKESGSSGNDFSLDVDIQGGNQPVVLIGPNGSGKTTLLLLIAGIIKPSSGKIVVNDRVLFDSSKGIDLPPEERLLAYVPQSYGLFPHLSVLANVSFGLSFTKPKLSSTQRRDLAIQILQELGIEHLQERQAYRLSGGEAQRVALARALVINPPLLLFDEPMAALDVVVKKNIREFLHQRLIERQQAAILTSHDIRDVKLFSGLIYVLEKGRIAANGSLSDLQKQPSTAFLEEFLRF